MADVNFRLREEGIYGLSWLLGLSLLSGLS